MWIGVSEDVSVCVQVFAVPGRTMVSASVIVRAHRLAGLAPLTPAPSPSPLTTPGHMGALGGFATHHFLWLAVGSNQGGASF